jgi:hypothetical protein
MVDKPEDKSADVKPLSPIAMTPDEYAARVQQEEDAALKVEEKALGEKQKAQADQLAAQHKAEKDALAKKREALAKKSEAVKQYVEMWQRQSNELATANPAHRDAIIAKHDAEHVDLAHATGFDVAPPTVGDTVRTNWPAAPMPGHPWIRPLRSDVAGRLHPQV